MTTRRGLSVACAVRDKLRNAMSNGWRMEQQNRSSQNKTQEH
jgi:hypothetical protein